MFGKGSTRLSGRSMSPSINTLSPTRWIVIPVLEDKFRFKVPLNCHATKSIMAALTHASKIVNTASQQNSDGEVSTEFGILMNDGPISDSMSSHSYARGAGGSEVQS